MFPSQTEYLIGSETQVLHFDCFILQVCIAFLFNACRWAYFKVFQDKTVSVQVRELNGDIFADNPNAQFTVTQGNMFPSPAPSLIYNEINDAVI
jgi:hypothetical protein